MDDEACADEDDDDDDIPRRRRSASCHLTATMKGRCSDAEMCMDIIWWEKNDGSS